MKHAHSSTSDSAQHRRITFWLWLVFGLILISAGSLRVWQNHQRRARYQAWQRQVERGQQLLQETQERIQALLEQHRLPDSLHRAEFEQLLNEGRPLAVSRQGGKDVAIWTDPISRATFKLYFRKDKWTGYNYSGGNNPKDPPAPAPPFLDETTEGIRSLIAGWNKGWGPGAWVVVLVLCLALKRRRLLLAQLLLGTALVCFTAWLVAPNYNLTLRGITSNDMLFWGVLMLGLSVTVLVWEFFEDRRRRRSGLLCPECEYDLRANVTGTCPECGCRISQDLQLRIETADGVMRS